MNQSKDEDLGGCMIELLFLLGFSLHNIEEAIWLPSWSKNAGKFHPPVKQNEFMFAIVIVTMLGYLGTFQFFIFQGVSNISKSIYLGFILMMVLNSIFPHLVATIYFKRYAPGTITALFLNLPIGLYLILTHLKTRQDLFYMVISAIIMIVLFMSGIEQIFKLGDKLFEERE